jgi:hypothetical protein
MSNSLPAGNLAGNLLNLAFFDAKLRPFRQFFQ